MSDISQENIFKAFSDTGKAFTFSIEPKNWAHKMLQRIKVLPKNRVLNVKPIRYGVRGICATHINKAVFDKYTKNTVLKAGSLFAEHELDNVIMFLATVLWNREDPAPEWLIDGVRKKNQFEIDEIIEFAHMSLNTEAFLNSIISMTGVSLQPEEIIAPEKESQKESQECTK